MTERNVVQFKNVSFKYEENGPWVVKNCTFDIFENEWIAIIGHNGSGKSTIAKLMNGLLFPNEGEIIINGVQVTEETIWDVRKDIGLVFQNPDNQFVGTTVKDDIAFGMENRGVEREEMNRRIQQTLKAVEMSDYMMTEPHRLSGGQKQRVAIASVFAIAPRVLILDEATTMLDPRGRTEIMDTVRQIQNDTELVLITITHDLNEITEADRVVVMNEGEIWSQSTPRNVFSKQEELHNIGLDVPFVTSLTNELQQAGVKLTNEPLNQDELLEDLWTLHLKT